MSSQDYPTNLSFLRGDGNSVIATFDIKTSLVRCGDMNLYTCGSTGAELLIPVQAVSTNDACGTTLCSAVVDSSTAGAFQAKLQFGDAWRLLGKDSLVVCDSRGNKNSALIVGNDSNVYLLPHSDASAAMFALLTASASRAVGFKSELAAVDAAHVAKVAALMRVAELAAERAAEDVAAIAAEAAQGKAIASQVALAADAQHCSDHSLAQAALSGLASDLKAATASGSAASAALVRSERSLASSRAESIRLEAQVAGYKSLCVERDEALRVSKSEASAAHRMLGDAVRSSDEAARFTDRLAEDAKATDAAYVESQKSAAAAEARVAVAGSEIASLAARAFELEGRLQQAEAASASAAAPPSSTPILPGDILSVLRQCRDASTSDKIELARCEAARREGASLTLQLCDSLASTQATLAATQATLDVRSAELQECEGALDELAVALKAMGNDVCSLSAENADLGRTRVAEVASAAAVHASLAFEVETLRLQLASQALLHCAVPAAAACPAAPPSSAPRSAAAFNARAALAAARTSLPSSPSGEGFGARRSLIESSGAAGSRLGFGFAVPASPGSGLRGGRSSIEDSPRFHRTGDLVAPRSACDASTPSHVGGVGGGERGAGLKDAEGYDVMSPATQNSIALYFASVQVANAKAATAAISATSAAAVAAASDAAAAVVVASVATALLQ